MEWMCQFDRDHIHPKSLEKLTTVPLIEDMMMQSTIVDVSSRIAAEYQTNLPEGA